MQLCTESRNRKINKTFSEWNMHPIEIEDIQEDAKIKSNVSKEYIAEAFGEELVKINLYGDNAHYKLRDNVDYTVIKKRYVDL